MFLTGLQHFKIVTDHNPLIPILNSHQLDEIEDPSLQCLSMKLMAFNFTAEWCKGTVNQVPDVLSHSLVRESQSVDMLAEQDEDNKPAHSDGEE